MYPVILMAGHGLVTLAFSVLLMYYLRDTNQLKDVMTPPRFHNLGKLILAFNLLWSYVTFGQFLIIWSGNLPEFTPWYINRTEDGWQLLALALMLFHFAVPFFILLSRRIKKNPRTLWPIAALLFLMRAIDIYWIIVPDLYTEGFRLDPIWLLAMVGLGGLWVAAFVEIYIRRPLVPANELRKDPRILAGEHAHA